jgi:pimeloyl-ACP methyl ester carboxylesterase
MAFELRGIRDNVRRYVQNEIQATNRRGISPAMPTPQSSKSDHLVRRHAIDSPQAAAIGISRCQGVLGHLSALSGAWESDGRFLEKSPHENILDIIDDLPRGMEEIAFGRRFRLSPDQIFVIGGSFGGAAAILLSLDPRVKRVIANCPVVDWGILDRSEKMETIKENYAGYIREAFGNGYRLADADWDKLRSGTFYNPWHHRNGIDGSKIYMFHAKDDANVPYERTRRLAEITASKTQDAQARWAHQHRLRGQEVVAADQEVPRFRSKRIIVSESFRL